MPTIYKSRLMKGGYPPLSGSQAGVAITERFQITVGTASNAFVQSDVIQLAQIPAGHELCNYNVYVGRRNETAANAGTFTLALLNSLWTTGSAAANIESLDTANLTTVTTASSCKFGDAANLALFTAVTTPGDGKIFGLYCHTANTTTGASTFTIIGNVSYKPVLGYEAAETLGT